MIAAPADQDKAAFGAMSKSDLIGQYMDLGLWIRNNPGLWQGNANLINDARGRDPSIRHPNSMSTIITDAVWERLRKIVPKVH